MVRRYGITRLVYAETTDIARDAIAREKQIKGWLRILRFAQDDPGAYHLGLHMLTPEATSVFFHRADAGADDQRSGRHSFPCSSQSDSHPGRDLARQRS